MNQRRVVVTGMGALTPLGNNVSEFWNGLISAKSGAGPITRFDTTKFKTKFACEVKNYNPIDHFEKQDVRKMDPFTQYALVTSAEAIKDSGLELDKIDKTRVGVIWGSGNGGFQTFQNEIIEYAKGDGTPRMNPYFIPKVLVDIASGWISIKYGFMGVNFTTVSACATSTTAIIDAMNYIRWNKADIIVTGGSEAAVNEAGIGGFSAMKALSTRNDDPQTASRPFDVDRDGFVMGEGAGALILEEYEHAKKRGAKIYGRLAGIGMSNDAYHITAPEPEGEGSSRAIAKALRSADLSPLDIGHVNAHATSTPVGDIAESNTILRSVGGHPVVTSTKSMTGHMLGAAGSLEAIATMLSVKEGIIPGSRNITTIDPEIKVDVATENREVTLTAALNDSFGFGGHNVALIFTAA